MTNSNQYFLLADHIKLSLLERRRTISMNRHSTTHDLPIAKSLASLQEGIEKVILEQEKLEELGDQGASQSLKEVVRNLQSHYRDLDTQFRNNPSPGNTSSYTDSIVNDLIPSDDPTDPVEKSGSRLSSSLSKTSFRGKPSITSTIKSVRFSESPSDEHLVDFPYQDDPRSFDPSYRDHQKIFSNNNDIIAQQDESLDRLGESLGRQRELSIQIGSELDEQSEMLESVDRHVERHQARLKHTMNRMERVVRSAKGKTQIKVFAGLITLLIFLIVLLKF